MARAVAWSHETEARLRSLHSTRLAQSELQPLHNPLPLPRSLPYLSLPLINAHILFSFFITEFFFFVRTHYSVFEQAIVLCGVALSEHTPPWLSLTALAIYLWTIIQAHVFKIILFTTFEEGSANFWNFVNIWSFFSLFCLYFFSNWALNVTNSKGNYKVFQKHHKRIKDKRPSTDLLATGGRFDFRGFNLNNYKEARVITFFSAVDLLLDGWWASGAK